MTREEIKEMFIKNDWTVKRDDDCVTDLVKEEHPTVSLYPKHMTAFARNLYVSVYYDSIGNAFVGDKTTDVFMYVGDNTLSF